MNAAWWRHLVWGLCAALIALGAAAQSLLPLPAAKARVTDLSATLSEDQRARIESRLAAFEAASGTQIAVLLVPTVQPEDIVSYTQRLGDAWKLGRREVGDGVLFVVAVNDRAVRIATSKALEGALPDLAARRIIDQAVVPAFQRGDFAEGILAGVEQIISRVSGETPPPSPTAQRTGTGPGTTDWLVFLVFGVPIVSGVLRELLGNKLGTLATGVGAGVLAWFITEVLWIALGAGLVAMVAALVFKTLPLSAGARRGSRGWSGGSSGGWGGGDAGGGFRSGGGGDFGGGGASGRW